MKKHGPGLLLYSIRRDWDYVLDLLGMGNDFGSSFGVEQFRLQFSHSCKRHQRFIGILHMVYDTYKHLNDDDDGLSLIYCWLSLSHHRSAPSVWTYFGVYLIAEKEKKVNIPSAFFIFEFFSLYLELLLFFRPLMYLHIKFDVWQQKPRGSERSMITNRWFDSSSICWTEWKSVGAHVQYAKCVVCVPHDGHMEQRKFRRENTNFSFGEKEKVGRWPLPVKKDDNVRRLESYRII